MSAPRGNDFLFAPLGEVAVPEARTTVPEVELLAEPPASGMLILELTLPLERALRVRLLLRKYGSPVSRW